MKIKYLAFGLALSLLLCWHRPDGYECYDSIYEGMPASEAVSELEKSGYVLTGGGGDMADVVMVFTRTRIDPEIVFIIDRWGDNRLVRKEMRSAIEHLLW